MCAVLGRNDSLLLASSVRKNDNGLFTGSNTFGQMSRKYWRFREMRDPSIMPYVPFLECIFQLIGINECMKCVLTIRFMPRIVTLRPLFVLMSWLFLPIPLADQSLLFLSDQS